MNHCEGKLMIELITTTEIDSFTGKGGQAMAVVRLKNPKRGQPIAFSVAMLIEDAETLAAKLVKEHGGDIVRVGTRIAP